MAKTIANKTLIDYNNLADYHYRMSAIQEAQIKNIAQILQELDDNKQDNLVSGSTIKTINGETILGEGDIKINGKVYFGTSSTAESTQTKVVNCVDFKLETGATIFVKFTNAQGYDGIPKLNVNSTGAINVQYKSGTNGIKYLWNTGEVLGFIYDGTAWVTIGKSLASETYYGVTKLSSNPISTSTALALTPYAFTKVIENVVTGYPAYMASNTYSVGSRVRYGYYAYECKTAITTPETWNESHWTRLTSLKDEIDILNEKVDSVENEVNEVSLSNSNLVSRMNTIQNSLDPQYTVGEIPPITKGIYDYTRANRLMFLPADQIIVEHSTDGGVTWTSANASDDAKRNVFAQTRLYNFIIPLKNGIRSCDCMMRVTITGMKYNVPSGTAETSKYNYWNANYALTHERYCSLNSSFFWVNAVSDYIHCKYEAATGANPNDWQLRGEGFIAGWSGLNYVKTTSGTFGGTISQATNLWNHRYTFRTATIYKDFDDNKLQTSSNTDRQQIMEISAFGDNVWSAPNAMMKNNHLYSWEADGKMVLDSSFWASKYISSGEAIYAPTIYENYVALSNKYAAKADLEEIQETMADYQEQFVAIGRELEEMYVNVSCDHRYEITGNTGDEHGLAIDDQQMIIKKIKGRTLVRNQIYKPLKQGSAWGGGNISFDSDNIITLSGVQTYSYMSTDSFNDLMNLAHKYMIEFEVFANPNAIPIRYSWFNRYSFFNANTGVGVYRTIFTQPLDYLTQGTGEGIDGFPANTDLTGIKYRVRIIDLTLAYGVGNEPTTVEDVLNDFPEYISYDEGTFVHSNNKLISTGRNLWKYGDQTFTKEKYIYLEEPIKAGVYTISAFVTSTDIEESRCVMAFYSRHNVSGAYVTGAFFERNTRSFQKVVFLKDVYTISLRSAENYNASLNDTATWKDIQIEYGEIGTDYEPYKEEVIEVGELTEFDYIDNVSGNKVNSTTIYTITNSSPVAYNSAGVYSSFYISGVGALFKNKGSSYHSKFRTTSPFIMLTYVNTYDALIITTSKDYLTLDDFKASMSGVQIISESMSSTTTESNLPAGMAVYKGGMQIQEGTIPYMIKKQYSLSVKSQVLQNIETDRIQQKQIEALEKFLHQPLNDIPYYVEDPGYAETRLTQDTQINLSQMQGAFEIHLEGHRCIIIEPTDDEIGIYGDENLNGDATVYNYANIPSGCFSFASQGCIGFEGLESAGIRSILVEFVNNCFIIRSVFVGGI